MSDNKKEVSSLDKYIKEVWENYRDGFEEDAAKEVGIVVEDYERHPDTGSILADNSYIKNEDEVEERAKEMFIDAIIDDPFDYLDANIVRELINKLINEEGDKIREFINKLIKEEEGFEKLGKVYDVKREQKKCL